MKNHNEIGLNKAQSVKLAKALNTLLANYQLLYINLRGFHWNIKGNDFFELHLKFEEHYTNVQTKIDEIAERILTLGHTPEHSYSKYLKLSTIKEQLNVSSGKEGLKHILKAFSIIIPMQREILSQAQDANDEGTSALMSDYIREQEKTVWMLNAYLGK